MAVNYTPHFTTFIPSLLTKSNNNGLFQSAHLSPDSSLPALCCASIRCDNLYHIRVFGTCPALPQANCLLLPLLKSDVDQLIPTAIGCLEDVAIYKSWVRCNTGVYTRVFFLPACFFYFPFSLCLPQKAKDRATNTTLPPRPLLFVTVVSSCI